MSSFAKIFSAQFYAGETEPVKQQVAEWLSKAESVKDEAALKGIESELCPKTFLVSDLFTQADAALFASLHPVLSTLPPTALHAYPSVTRYFDLLQHLPAIAAAAAKADPPLAAVPIDLTAFPKAERKAERKAEPSKDKKKKAGPAAEGAAGPAEPAAAAKEEGKGKKEEGKKEEGKKEGKKEKKEKKEKAAGGQGQGSQGKGKGTAAVPEVPIPSMIDLRVGKIVEVARHPDADSLYVEQIDLAEPTGPRTVVSGLVKYIPIEEMRDRLIIVVCNLKPANMRGVKSHAMVLCASAKEGKEGADGGVEFVKPPPGSQPGDRVFFEGFEDQQALEQLPPKKKIFETIQPGFTTLDTYDAVWVNPENGKAHAIVTAKGPCRATRFKGASLS